MTITERLHNEQKRLITLFTIIEGKGFYIEDGKPYTRKEFEDKYPVPLRARAEEKENADPKQNWLFH
jgi:hypothetical protein